MSLSSHQYRWLRLVRLFRRLQKIWVDWRGTSGQIYFEHRVGEYERIWEQVAEDLDAELLKLADEVWEFRRGKQRTRVNNYQLEYDNPVVLRIAGNKPLVHQLLVNRDLPVPMHKTFRLRDLDVANSFLKGHQQGCVVKPADGFGGKGVTTHVQNYAELKRAAVLASLYSPNLLIEQQIPGESYRLLVLNGKMVHAVCRRGLRLIADGSSTIAELIADRNAQLKREGAPIIDLDRDLDFTLDYQELDLESIPMRDEAILIKSINDPARKQVEVRTVYGETVTDQVCDEIVQQAEMAAREVGSDFAGVDIIARRIDVPLEESGGVINEINTTPALHHHYDSSTETYPEVAVQAISLLLDRGQS
ncbi:MAG: hypothetical protein AMJ68_08615 [Acidithiobacillales bacterium SG8_45]|nr:MAG: hypothetical protein AMJ68_08615 [Acidithiobacillales bacterium SG8_45]